MRLRAHPGLDSRTFFLRGTNTEEPTSRRRYELRVGVKGLDRMCPRLIRRFAFGQPD